MNSENKANILIVDDIPNNIRILSTILTERGYQVRKAINGEMALKIINTKLPDLILLDINMPGLNGYQVCQHLKAETSTKDIPIIFISALDEIFDKLKAFAVGGVDFITKPFSEEEVFARVEAHLLIRRLQQQVNQLQEENKDLQAKLAQYLN